MLHNFSRALELRDRIETDYLRILYYDFPADYSGVYKTYEYSRMCTILSGEKLININSNNPFSYDRSQFLLLPPTSEISMKIEKPTKAVVFEMNDDLIKKVNDKAGAEYEMDESELKDSFLHSQLTAELNDVLNKIAAAVVQNGKNQEFLIDLFAQEMVYYLVKIKGTNKILNGDSGSPISRALSCINSEYAKPISIRRIAAEAKMSESNFCQYFKRLIGVTPKEYITNLRLLKAKELILKSSVTDVAYDLGYDSISHFISLFRNKYGMTPKQYQKSYLENTNLII